MSANTPSNTSSCGCPTCDSEINFDTGAEDNNGVKAGLSSHRKKLYRVILGIILFSTALILNVSTIFSLSTEVYFGLIFASYILAGGEVVFRAGRNITKGQVFDENFLMSIATIGAFLIGEYPEGAAVMLFYQVGVLLESAAINRSKRSIESLMNIRPDYANLKTKEGHEKVSPSKVKPGDIIIIKPGEKVPLDGKVLKGRSTADTSVLTGESLPTSLSEGDDVLAGFINNTGLLTVEVTKEFENSSVSKILDLVQNASSKKAPTEKFITRFARYYTPVVVFAAMAIAFVPPLILQGATFSEWIYRALVFLVISCPCALVVSIPIGFVGGIGKASRSGVLIKGSNYLEALNHVDTVIFDKTGTLTKGEFEVSEINSTSNYSEEEILRLAFVAEEPSTHPLAKAVKKAYSELKESDFSEEKIDGVAGSYESYDYESYEELPGMGVKVKLKDDKELLAGNNKLMEREKIIGSEDVLKSTGEKSNTVIHLAVEGEYVGNIKASDTLKEGASDTIQYLRKAGINNIAVLSGDVWESVNSTAKKLGIDKVYAELLPEEKLSKLEAIYDERQNDSKLLYVGDGINDAPVIARADVGIAMGGLGSDAAVESSDIVLMTDEPGKLKKVISIAKETRWIVWQNIILSLGVKGLVLLLGAMGLASMWQAVIADVGVMFLAAMNSLRLSFS
ncbi:heavy metal translocating P-type ATPase [Natranaerofaba carboxydovora]|uniref:heavy metal translocating P-type ATPase n=1 Tax=Natranaerofaba carboxydovora TaxID=2742683 RepID=UPI001F1365FD|nr:heavy metal translocating P-type ATPase [Natranaerofaba carboxydovora]UMZ74114.1 Cadmium, zinc and cobalt-transporting ATPase [Natranaerofaba carboxydovora]